MFGQGSTGYAARGAGGRTPAGVSQLDETEPTPSEPVDAVARDDESAALPMPSAKDRSTQPSSRSLFHDPRAGAQQRRTATSGARERGDILGHALPQGHPATKSGKRGTAFGGAKASAQAVPGTTSAHLRSRNARTRHLSRESGAGRPPRRAGPRDRIRGNLPARSGASSVRTARASVAARPAERRQQLRLHAATGIDHMAQAVRPDAVSRDAGRLRERVLATAGAGQRFATLLRPSLRIAVCRSPPC